MCSREATVILVFRLTPPGIKLMIFTLTGNRLITNTPRMPVCLVDLSVIIQHSTHIKNDWQNKKCSTAKKEIISPITAIFPSKVGRVMEFNATFNNISAISWGSVLMVEETDLPEENH
jgi:hypothetical protein